MPIDPLHPWRDDRASNVTRRPPAFSETSAAVDTSGEEDSEAIATRQRLLGIEFPGVRQYDRGEPSFGRYPIAKFVTPVIHGVDQATPSLGFDGRAVGGQNLTASYIYIDAVRFVIPPRCTFAWNLPTAVQSLSFAWWATAFGGAVAPVAGQYAVIYLWDEWVPPSLVQVA